MSRTTAASNAVAALEKRADRARLLADEPGSARVPLRFASALFLIQARQAEKVGRLHRASALSGSLAVDVDRLVRLMPGFLEETADVAPEELADEAADRADEGATAASGRLLVYWSGEREVRADYLSRAILRPYVAVLADLAISPDRPRPPGHCPFCGGRPLISARRDLPDGHGTPRFLGCSLCVGEWPFRRILCPSCGEEEPERLPSFQDGRHPFVRIEACETCRRYVKSIDLSLDARLVPEVDDILSVSFDLWAAEQGYERIEPGLAGL